ncbi:MAG: hypothetical protein AB7L94_11885, partial [Kofleriaceae bacterium]
SGSPDSASVTTPCTAPVVDDCAKALDAQPETRHDNATDVAHPDRMPWTSSRGDRQLKRGLLAAHDRVRRASFIRDRRDHSRRLKLPSEPAERPGER